MYKILAVLAAILAESVGRHQCITSTIVSTPSGQFQGSIIQSRLGRSIYSFRGIRYAEPPVGDLRFEAPVPIENYEGIYNATADGAVCPQPTTDPTSEDCLFLNVYTTKLPTRSKTNIKRPVIFYLHAGGFYSGSSASYLHGPQYFMDQDIVLVTINYRLGSLGFLSTGTKEAPGNNGLKDQVVALKWVQKNIESFGGDANSVTIMGYSVGAMSVDLHLVSPMSVGLFHRAAAMSYSTFAQWTIEHDQLDLAKKQARFVNCPDDTPTNIISCLKTKSASDIANTLSKFDEFGSDPVIVWKPVIENDFGQARFLTEQPVTLVKNGNFTNVPYVTGITTEEFSYKSIYVVRNETYVNILNNHWEETAPIPFLYERNTEKSRNISKGLRKFYFDDEPISNATQIQLGELYADSTVGFGVNRAAKLVSFYNNASSFYYKFSFQGRYSHFSLAAKNETTPYGVVHHDDLIYLFYISKLFPFFSNSLTREAKMVDKLTLLYANFAKYGNPIPATSETLDNVSWETFNIQSQKYMDIGDTLKMKEKLFEDRYLIWEQLFPLNITS